MRSSGNIAEPIASVLERTGHGDAAAAEELLRLLYGELRRLAAAKMAGEPAQTLQPTALVHEAWIRLGGDCQPTWQNRAHFFGAAAQAMRRILVEHARHRRALRHGGGQARVDVDEVTLAETKGDDDRFLAVDEALDRLAQADGRSAELVKLHYFGGLTMKETSDVMGISEATAWRWWAYARAWLFNELRKD